MSTKAWVSTPADSPAVRTTGKVDNWRLTASRDPLIRVASDRTGFNPAGCNGIWRKSDCICALGDQAAPCSRSKLAYKSPLSLRVFKPAVSIWRHRQLLFKLQQSTSHSYHKWQYSWPITWSEHRSPRTGVYPICPSRPVRPEQHSMHWQPLSERMRGPGSQDWCGERDVCKVQRQPYHTGPPRQLTSRNF